VLSSLLRLGLGLGLRLRLRPWLWLWLWLWLGLSSTTSDDSNVPTTCVLLADGIGIESPPPDELVFSGLSVGGDGVAANTGLSGSEEGGAGDFTTESIIERSGTLEEGGGVEVSAGVDVALRTT